MCSSAERADNVWAPGEWDWLLDLKQTESPECLQQLEHFSTELLESDSAHHCERNEPGAKVVGSTTTSMESGRLSAHQPAAVPEISSESRQLPTCSTSVPAHGQIHAGVPTHTSDAPIIAATPKPGTSTSRLGVNQHAQDLSQQTSSIPNSKHTTTSSVTSYKKIVPKSSVTFSSSSMTLVTATPATMTNRMNLLSPVKCNSVQKEISPMMVPPTQHSNLSKISSISLNKKIAEKSNGQKGQQCNPTVGARLQKSSSHAQIFPSRIGNSLPVTSKQPIIMCSSKVNEKMNQILCNDHDYFKPAIPVIKKVNLTASDGHTRMRKNGKCLLKEDKQRGEGVDKALNDGRGKEDCSGECEDFEDEMTTRHVTMIEDDVNIEDAVEEVCTEDESKKYDGSMPSMEGNNGSALEDDIKIFTTCEESGCCSQQGNQTISNCLTENNCTTIADNVENIKGVSPVNNKDIETLLNDFSAPDPLSSIVKDIFKTNENKNVDDNDEFVLPYGGESVPPCVTGNGIDVNMTPSVKCTSNVDVRKPIVVNHTNGGLLSLDSFNLDEMLTNNSLLNVVRDSNTTSSCSEVQKIMNDSLSSSSSSSRCKCSLSNCASRTVGLNETLNDSASSLSLLTRVNESLTSRLNDEMNVCFDQSRSCSSCASSSISLSSCSSSSQCCPAPPCTVPSESQQRQQQPDSNSIEWFCSNINRSLAQVYSDEIDTCRRSTMEDQERDDDLFGQSVLSGCDREMISSMEDFERRHAEGGHIFNSIDVEDDEELYMPSISPCKMFLNEMEFEDEDLGTMAGGVGLMNADVEMATNVDVGVSNSFGEKLTVDATFTCSKSPCSSDPGYESIDSPLSEISCMNDLFSHMSQQMEV